MLYYSEEETKVSTELKKLCYYHIKEGTFFFRCTTYFTLLSFAFDGQQMFLESYVIFLCKHCILPKTFLRLFYANL